ncbi:MAG: hypothetical protein GX051_08315 [Clostridiales bacterium]|nr:hypothetical protein [Clostridiales bacterium]
MKKAFKATAAVALALVQAVCLFSVASSALVSVKLGDLNNNGIIEAADARTALRIATRLESASDYQLRSGDLNADGSISAAEAREILRAATKLSTLEKDTADFYSVTLPQSELFSINKVSGTTLANAGDSFAFMLDIAPSCSQSNPVVKLNGEEITAEDGVYTVADIRADCTVTVEDVKLNTYSVTLPRQTGATFSPYGSANPDFVEHGKSFRFTVALDAAYSGSSLTVRANGTKLTPASGIYTVEEITADTVITVSGLKINTYTVTLPKETDENGIPLGFTIVPEQGCTSPVAYAGSYSFKVILADSCSQSDITVKANSVELTADADGIYTIENIKANQSVTVSGVKANPTGVMVLEDSPSNKFIVAAAAERDGSSKANMVAIYEERFDSQPSDSNFVLEFDGSGTKSPDTLKYVYYIKADMTVKTIKADSALLLFTDTEGYIAVKLIKDQIMPQYPDYFDGV